jgi:hypothetical protein
MSHPKQNIGEFFSISPFSGSDRLSISPSAIKGTPADRYDFLKCSHRSKLDYHRASISKVGLQVQASHGIVIYSVATHADSVQGCTNPSVSRKKNKRNGHTCRYQHWECYIMGNLVHALLDWASHVGSGTRPLVIKRNSISGPPPTPLRTYRIVFGATL